MTFPLTDMAGYVVSFDDPHPAARRTDPEVLIVDKLTTAVVYFTDWLNSKLRPVTTGEKNSCSTLISSVKFPKHSASEPP